jgi:hypothetical protein
MAITRNDLTLACQVEIIPPERADPDMESKTCLCCEQRRPASCMDEDGCGICEECLSP